MDHHTAVRRRSLPATAKGQKDFSISHFSRLVVRFPSDRDLTTYAVGRPGGGIQTIQYNTIPNENKGSANESMRKAWARSELEKDAVWRFEGGGERNVNGQGTPTRENTKK